MTGARTAIIITQPPIPIYRLTSLNWTLEFEHEVGIYVWSNVLIAAFCDVYVWQSG